MSLTPTTPALADHLNSLLVSLWSPWTALPPLPRSGACSRRRPLSTAVRPRRRPTPAIIWKRRRRILVRHGHAHPTRVPPWPREPPVAWPVLDLGAPAMADVIGPFHFLLSFLKIFSVN
jgi:hypothetical protein